MKKELDFHNMTLMEAEEEIERRLTHDPLFHQAMFDEAKFQELVSKHVNEFMAEMEAALRESKT